MTGYSTGGGAAGEQGEAGCRHGGQYTCHQGGCINTLLLVYEYYFMTDVFMIRV